MSFSMDDLLEMVIESSMEYEDMIIEEVEDDEFLESEDELDIYEEREKTLMDKLHQIDGIQSKIMNYKISSDEKAKEDFKNGKITKDEYRNKITTENDKMQKRLDKNMELLNSLKTKTESTIDDVFAFQTYVREEAGIPVNKEKIDKLEEQIQALDEKYEQAKKKLVEGFYTDDQFDVMTKAHEREVKHLRDKIESLK